MPKGDHATAKLHREWLRRVATQINLSPTTLAKRVGIAPSTLTRLLAESDNGTSTLHANTIDKIVAFTGIAPPGTAAGVGGKPLRGFHEDAAPFTYEKGAPLTSAVQALIAGRNGIDPWTVKTRALELVGYLPGDVVLVDLNGEPQPGDAVCAQIYDWSKGRAETVLRVYERAGAVDLLIARSMDEAFNHPLQLDRDRVVIKGVLLPHRFRPQVAA